jgi:hypothetical protein
MSAPELALVSKWLSQKFDIYLNEFTGLNNRKLGFSFEIVCKPENVDYDFTDLIYDYDDIGIFSESDEAEEAAILKTLEYIKNNNIKQNQNYDS